MASLTNKDILILDIIQLMTEEKLKEDDAAESLISFATKLGTAIDKYGLKLKLNPVDNSNLVTVDQLVSITDPLFNSLIGKEDKINKGMADGYAPLDSLTKILSSYLYVVNDTVTGGADSIASAETVKNLQLQINSITTNGGDKAFTHNQISSITVWTINHNMGKYPSVTILDSSGTEYEGDVQHTDINNLTITFSIAFSGKAIMN